MAAAGCKSTKAAAREKKAPAVGSGHRYSRRETTDAATASAKLPANDAHKRQRDLPDVALTDADLPYIEPKAMGKKGKKKR